jgi:CRP-like cAMP-binding protein
MRCAACPNLVLSDLSPACHAEIQKIGRARRFPRKRVIYREGEISQGIFCLRSGLVKRTVENETGTQRVLGLVPQGQFLGLDSLWGAHTYIDTAVALAASEMCFFAREEILAAVERHPEVGIRLAAHLSGRLREAEQRLKELALGSARERLALTLLSLGQEFGCRENGTTVLDLPLSRSELAGLASVSLGTASRLVGEWKRDCLVDTRGRRVMIIDPEGLRPWDHKV